MSNQIKKQLEQLMDESQGPYSDVIVQFKSTRSDAIEKLIEAAVETERMRSLMVDPANMLPPSRAQLEKGRTSRRALKDKGASLSANVAQKALSPIVGLLMGDSPSAADGFLKLAEVRSAIARVPKA